MTDTIQHPITFNSIDVEAELERVDSQAGHEYVPMDVFVNPAEMKEHFKYSSIRTP